MTCLSSKKMSVQNPDQKQCGVFVLTSPTQLQWRMELQNSQQRGTPLPVHRLCSLNKGPFRVVHDWEIMLGSNKPRALVQKAIKSKLESELGRQFLPAARFYLFLGRIYYAFNPWIVVEFENEEKITWGYKLILFTVIASKEFFFYFLLEK